MRTPTQFTFAQRYGSSLAFADYRWVWIGSLMGQSAYWALIVARGILVLEMTGSSTLVGVTTFAAMAPRFFMPPLAGYLADRFDRRAVLASSYALQSTQVALLAALAYADMLAVWHIVALSVVNGAFRGFQMTATQALIPNLVPREHWLNAISLNQASTQGARLVGPALITPALLFWGPGEAFLASTLLYLVGVAAILAVQTRSTGELGRGSKMGSSLMEGVRYAWMHPHLRLLFIFVALHCSLTMAYESTLPAFAREVLSDGRAGVSYLMMGVGTGALIGVFGVAGVRSAAGRGRALFITGVLSGVSMVVLSVASNPATAVVAAAGMGGSQAAFMAISGAMVQSLAPDGMRGRISGLNQINVGGTMAAVNLANGFAADAMGAPLVLLTLGLAFVGVMAAGLLVSRLRGVFAGSIGVPVRAS